MMFRTVRRFATKVADLSPILDVGSMPTATTFLRFGSPEVIRKEDVASMEDGTVGAIPPKGHSVSDMLSQMSMRFKTIEMDYALIKKAYGATAHENASIKQNIALNAQAISSLTEELASTKTRLSTLELRNLVISYVETLKELEAQLILAEFAETTKFLKKKDLTFNYLRTGPLAISPEVTIFLQDPRVAKLEKFKLSSAGKKLYFKRDVFAHAPFTSQAELVALMSKSGQHRDEFDDETDALYSIMASFDFGDILKSLE